MQKAMQVQYAELEVPGSSDSGDLHDPCEVHFVNQMAEVQQIEGKALQEVKRSFLAKMKIFVTLAVAAAAVGGGLGKWRSFEVVQVALQLVGAAAGWQLCEVLYKLSAQFQLLSRQVHHVRFALTCRGGNACKVACEIWNKVGFVEWRLMNLSQRGGDTARLLITTSCTYITD